MAPLSSSEKSKGEFVVLLHGILRSKLDMLPLLSYLKKHGYDGISVLYPSRKKSIEDLTDFVEEKIHACADYSGDKTLHFVTHSLGGLVARHYIASRKPANLGRVVMLGPPNTGSEFSDFLQEHKILSPLYKKIYGPAGQQLGTAYKHADAINFPLGVIAGSKSINPLSPWVLPVKRVGPHDGIVPVARTKIEGMADHIVMPSTHSLMMFNPRVITQVKYFLENGKFRV